MKVIRKLSKNLAFIIIVLLTTSFKSNKYLTVYLKLSDIPGRLSFNQPLTRDNHLEYSWSIYFNLDKNDSTGLNGYDACVSVSAYKFPGAVLKTGSILEHTQKNVWLYNGKGFSSVSNAFARINKKDNIISLKFPNDFNKVRIENGTPYKVAVYGNNSYDESAIGLFPEGLQDPINPEISPYLDLVEASFKNN